MPCPAKGGVVFPYYELAVTVRLRLPDFNPVILQRRAQSVIKLHGTVTPAEDCLCTPCPRVRVTENGAVLLQARIDTRNKTDSVVRLRIAGGVEHQAEFRKEITVHVVHGRKPLLPIRSTGNHRPGV